MIINKQESLTTLFDKHLKPRVREIDSGYYPKDIVKLLGKDGYFSSKDLTLEEIVQRELQVVKQASAICMTTGFLIWCHLASLTYIRNSENEPLKNRFLTRLEQGETVASTGLSNAMKYYAGLEKLHLKAEETEEGYILSGTLPAVSNLASDHWFGAVAEVSENKRVLVFVSCETKGLTLKEKTDFLGINGSGTFACQFDQVFIPTEQVIAEDANTFIQSIRPTFLAYQIPLGLGVIEAALHSIKRSVKRQGESNSFLPVQPDEIEEKLNLLQTSLQSLFARPAKRLEWKDVVSIRRDTANLNLQAVHAAMLHGGGVAYLENSADSRRLREAYFLANLTPTIKHLEKMLHLFKQQK
ncbi:acyl-CoA/acyl-ACP dehydrogenase [Halalkalibacter nanhaiisediminis]|uniref:Alkylation response protein AidB-like acyl-CoA dehydrogenase n=1 Tax=Halalkalibacter nanhaiisediminis TaxID=688079 RepID=A0A562QBG5_9BACI|nr:acyl-CoA/acyl-ACP dehydrogenase [Halalkalibacter nanhaiisediminis]TWI54097.1 hypothetical protein IQ10_03200 [Halalkalibacter nanhaiisediminis]